MKAFVAGCLAAAVYVATALAPVAARADDLDAIKSSGEMKVAMTGQYPPFSFVNARNEVVGFDAAIGAEIARRLGVKQTVVATAWDGIIAGLRAKKYHTVVGSMTITPEREKAVDFVGPYYHAGRGVFVTAGSSIQSLDELKDRTIGVTLGETHDKWAREKGGWTIRTYGGLPELLLELKAGRVDAIVNDDVPVIVATKDSADKVRQLSTPDIEGGRMAQGIAIRKGNPALKAAMQKALDEMMADGTYAKISNEWIGRDIR